MRILHVVHEFGPGGGGTQGYVSGLALRQLGRGDALAVVCARRRPGPIDARIHVHEVQPLPHELHSGDVGSAHVGAQIGAALAAFAPDLVHVHHWFQLTNDLVRLVRQRGVPVVATLHDLYVSCARSFRMPRHRELCAPTTSAATCAACLAVDVPQPAAGQLERAIELRQAAFQAELAACNAVLTMSRAQTELLREVGALTRRTQVLPIGITDALTAVTAPAAGPRLRVVNWGGLDPRKGIHVLVAAVAGSRLRDQMHVDFHGADPAPAYAHELQQLAAGASVHLHGPFDAADLATFAGRHDVAVFPSLAFETHGLAVDEALHLGLPVVVSAHGAPAERIGGRGIAVPPGDTLALRRVLEELVTDRGRLATLRAGSHLAITLDEHERQLRVVYEQVTGQSPLPPASGR